MRVMVVIGARPQIIKSAPIIHDALKDSTIELQIVHTGQHYDFEMSKIFFGEFALPDPTINLGVGSGSHAWQTGKMLAGLEKAMLELKPDVVVVPGDTNSTLAGALAAVKLHVPVAHVEAGARSCDMAMPEEVNRRLTDHCAQLLFAPTEACLRNLSKEGVPKDTIFLSGDTMYDALLQHLTENLDGVLDRLDLERETYGVLTLHRPSNVDDQTRLKNIMRVMMDLDDLVIVFPVHPRTEKMLRAVGLLKDLKKSPRLRLMEPVSYHSMLGLMRNSRMVLTDSGGMQKEAFWLHVPCITIRDTTEWGETVALGANALAEMPERIIEKAKGFLADKALKKRLRTLPNPFGDGRASAKIVHTLKSYVAT